MNSPILGVVSPKVAVEPHVTVGASVLPAKASAPGGASSQKRGAGLHITRLSTLPASVQATLTADLIDDLLLMPEKLKVLQDNLKSCYKITMVSIY